MASVIDEYPRDVLEQSQRQLARAWEDYLSGEDRATLPVRTQILDSWERCRDARVSVRTAFAPRIDGDALTALQEINRELLEASVQTLADASTLLAGSDALMLVTDPQGIVLKVVGDGPALHAGLDIALCAGGDWREDVAGTNGIGTTLTASRPMLVHSGEHYCEGMKTWSCAAAPIRNPLDGSLMGAIDVSVRSHLTNSQICSLSVLGARRVEQSMLTNALARRSRLMAYALNLAPRGGNDTLILLDAGKRLVHAGRGARETLYERLGIRLPVGSPELWRPDSDPIAFHLPLADIPREWSQPVEIDGRIEGHIILIPERGRAARSISNPTGDERDVERASFQAIIGKSRALMTAVERAKRIARTPAPVVIEGETGVGKELFARAIHGSSAVCHGPFVAFNCGAVSRELIASELFGYAKGAFTGASAEGRAGRFELAHGGTLCLDEVGELGLHVQTYLLRVLEEGAVSRIGESRVRRVDVRIVAMTNRCLASDVEAGRFRRDLYHRLAVMTVEIPPLRERDGDIPLLLDHFCEQLAGQYRRPAPIFPPECRALLDENDWPGNIREFRNIVERATVFAEGGIVSVGDLQREIGAGPIVRKTGRGPDSEAHSIRQAVAQAGGNMSSASEALGISRATLYRRLARLGLDRRLLNPFQGSDD